MDIEEVKALNKKQGNELSVFEVLKIPYVAPYIQQDGEYYYHKGYRLAGYQCHPFFQYGRIH